MTNFIINNETVAVLKKNKKIIKYNVDNYEVINKNLNSFLDFNCLYYGSSLKGRIKYAKLSLNISYKCPILISEKENLILIPLNSLKNEETILIMLNKIKDYQENGDMLSITCVNNQVFSVKLSKYSFEKSIINALKLNNQIKWLNY